MTTVLNVKQLSKSYGSIRAVDSLSFEVRKGSVFGILGPNGSGKTTTLGMLTTAINPLSGNFEWFGKTPTAETRKNIGILLEKPNFYDYLSAINNLKIVADIRSLSYDLIEPSLKMVSLWERRNSKFKTYSLGMKQRLAIASAVMGDPDVLILDEPTNGLDPTGIAEVRDLIRNLAGQGKTIILASHLLDEVQKVCTDLLVMKRGKRIFIGNMDDLSRTKAQLELMSNNNNKMIDLLISYPNVGELKADGNIVVAKLMNDATAEDVNSFLHQNGVFLNHLVLRKANLESQVLDLLKDN
jgi:ABC-2 type transport system ATP-binding protein